MRMTRKRLPLRYVIYLLLLTMLTTGVSLSRYQTTIAGSATVSVARPVVEYVPGQATLNGASVSLATGLSGLLPGANLVYPFTVTNTDTSGRTQVAMRYQVRVVFDPATLLLPLTYTLVAEGSYDQNGDGWNELGFDAPITHRYILTISWAANKTEAIYMTKTQNVSIFVDAQQVN